MNTQPASLDHAAADWESDYRTVLGEVMGCDVGPSDEASFKCQAPQSSQRGEGPTLTSAAAKWRSAANVLAQYTSSRRKHGTCTVKLEAAHSK